MQWRRSISGLHFVLGGSLGIPLIPGLLPRSPLLARIRCTHSLEAYTHAHTSARALRPSPSPHISSPIFSPLLSHPRFCLCSLSLFFSLSALSFSLVRPSLFSLPLSVSTCGPRGFVGRDAARCARATREILIKIREGPPPPIPPTSQPHRRELRRYSDVVRATPLILSLSLAHSLSLTLPPCPPRRLSLVVSLSTESYIYHDINIIINIFVALVPLPFVVPFVVVERHSITAIIRTMPVVRVTMELYHFYF